VGGVLVNFFEVAPRPVPKLNTAWGASAKVPKQKQFAQFAVDKHLHRANHTGAGRKFRLREKFPEREG
jgi:hypothetical protein